jgi:phage terminase large subunit-like protein
MEQGRLGAYADLKNIINGDAYFSEICTIYKSPREIRLRNGSTFFFNSYADSETAKGIACDWLYLNEANKFTKQQFLDLRANVRKGVFIDYNPNEKFWIEDFINEDEICTTTWRNNRKNLTPAQLQYFYDLKRDAEKPDATDMDIRNYRIYYLGEYYELRGGIFNSANIQVTEIEPEQKTKIVAFLDPSALRGADYFAMCLMCEGADGKKYVLETWSENTGNEEDIFNVLNKWRLKYGEFYIYIETNGIIGTTFYEKAQKRMPVISYYSRENKFERIVANYGELTKNVIFVRRYNTQFFLNQVYDFGEKCDHDDNIDCVNSAFNVYKYI